MSSFVLPLRVVRQKALVVMANQVNAQRTTVDGAQNQQQA